eukprot:5068516-Amphidinium_carterae.3
MNGIQRINKNELAKSVRCWRRGQLGHLSRNCPVGGEPTQPMSTQPNGQRNYFVLPFAGGSS